MLVSFNPAVSNKAYSNNKSYKPAFGINIPDLAKVTEPELYKLACEGNRVLLEKISTTSKDPTIKMIADGYLLSLKGHLTSAVK